MGWGSASSIYEPVREATRGMADEDRIKVLAPLIKNLLDGDWDTWEEVIDWDDEAELEAFRQAGMDLVAVAKVRKVEKLMTELIVIHKMDISIAEGQGYIVFSNDGAGFYETVWL